MCRITGIIDFNKQSSNEVLEAMTNTLKHRGLYGSGVICNTEVEIEEKLTLAITEFIKNGKVGIVGNDENIENIFSEK